MNFGKDCCVWRNRKGRGEWFGNVSSTKTSWRLEGEERYPDEVFLNFSDRWNVTCNCGRRCSRKLSATCLAVVRMRSTPRPSGSLFWLTIRRPSLRCGPLGPCCLRLWLQLCRRAGGALHFCYDICFQSPPFHVHFTTIKHQTKLVSKNKRPTELGYKKYGLPKRHFAAIYGRTKGAKHRQIFTLTRETRWLEMIRPLVLKTRNETAYWRFWPYFFRSFGP